MLGMSGPSHHQPLGSEFIDPALLGMPVPPHAVLPPDADEEAVCAAVAALDPGRRFGAAVDPVLLSAHPLDRPEERLFHIGLTEANAPWLVACSGERSVRAWRAELRTRLAGEPETAIGQTVAAVRAQAGPRRREPVVPVVLTVMPQGSGPRSGTGLAYSRDPETGEPGVSGSYRPGGTGRQLLTRGGESLASLVTREPWGAELAAVVGVAEERVGRPVRVEFVVDHGHPYVLAVRPARLTGAALLRSVADAGRAGRLSGPEALARVDTTTLSDALSPAVRLSGSPPAVTGIGVSPGVAAGVAVFSAADAVALREKGQDPVLVLRESRPEDLPGLLAASAVVTERGGRTSHAAVVARGLGRPCVTALAHSAVDAGRRTLRAGDGPVIADGDPVTVDGGAGAVHRGLRTPASGTRSGPEVTDAAAWLLTQADAVTGPGLRANADNAADARRGREAGAAGIGLCRIEHMFLGDRQPLLERVLLAAPGPESKEALHALGSWLREEFTRILAAMDGLPVTVRLLDPPRHEFLPDLAELTAQEAVARALGRPGPDPERLAVTRELGERNPMLGVRGVRLGLLMPDLTATQLRSLVAATDGLRRDGADPRPEVLVPMVSTPAEADAVRRILDGVLAAAGHAPDRPRIPLGVMIETPRSALLAGELAARADFLSLGTNDLTSLVWGLSRDDADRELLPRYIELGIVDDSPLERWDASGVGGLISSAITAARAVKPELSIGVCGEHASDPAAVRFLTAAGIDYLSCVPPQLPQARLARARAGLRVPGAPVPAGPDAHDGRDEG